jgi:glycosyltransferase involved in cell wall biosynthesis
LEAGQFSVPTVAFAVGGIPEWLIEGTNGHLAPIETLSSTALAGAIARCLENESHYRDLCKGAAQQTRRFSPEEHLSGLLSIFDRVAQGRLAAAINSR